MQNAALAANPNHVAALLDAIIAAPDNKVTLDADDCVRAAACQLQTALSRLDPSTAAQDDALATFDAKHLQGPEELRYLQLFRNSYTVEEICAPPENVQRSESVAQNSSNHGFRGAVKRALLASRFISATRRDSGGGRSELDAHMQHLASWTEFDVSEVARLSERQPLLFVGLSSLSHFNLLVALDIDVHTATNFVKVIEHHYQPNPYHNSTHAADVTQALTAMLSLDGLDGAFSNLELLAMLVAAIAHDVGHPGVSNGFLTKTQDDAALIYSDQSSNEALSLAITFKVLQARECNIFRNLSRSDYLYVRRLVTDIVLGTDMAAHSRMMDHVRRTLRVARDELSEGPHESGVWAALTQEGRILAMKLLVHSADLSNPCRPAALAGMWTRAVYEEFFRQGDAEKQLDLPISPLCDRDDVAIPDSQRVFLSFVVRPTCEALADLAPLSSAALLHGLEANLAGWTELANGDDRHAVLRDGSQEALHLAPGPSPFHSRNPHAWCAALLAADEFVTGA